MSESFELADEASGLGALIGPLFEVVASEFEVVDVVGEHPPDADEHRVRDSEDGFALALLPEPAREPAELGSEVGVAGLGRRPGRLAQRRAQRGVTLAGLAGTLFAGRLVMTWAQPGPRCEMAGGREAGHVDSDLGDHDLGGALTDPGHRAQPLDLFSERGELALHLLIEAFDRRTEVIDVREMRLSAWRWGLG